VKLGLVYNPTAGSGRRRAPLESVRAALEEAGAQVQLFPTRAAGDGTEQGRLAALAHPYVAVYGGDGSVNEVLNGVAASGQSPRVLLLPGGTMNVLCRDFGIPLDPVRAARLLGEGIPQSIYLGNANGRYFALMASAGLDASVVHYMNFRAGLKKGLGPWAFAWEALRHFWTYRFPPIEVVTSEGAEYLGYSVVVGKSKGYGGWFSITRDARATTPDFQVAVCVGRNRFAYFWYVLLALTGQLARSGDYRFFRTSRLQLRSAQPVRLQIDGDSAGDLPREFCVDGTTVQILCPAVKAKN